MRKRIGALGLAAILLLAMICPALAANGKAELSVKGPEGPIKAGESFTVTVEIKDNPGFVALELTLSYDSDMLKCTTAETGTVLDDMLSVTNPDGKNGAIVAAASADIITGNGVIAELSFTASKDVSALTMSLCDVIINDLVGNDLEYMVSYHGSMELASPEKESEPTLPNPEPVSEPASQHETEPAVEPQPVQEITFTDTKDHWAENYVSRAAELGLFKGYPDGSFQPNLNVTRAQYVTVLYRMAGSPAVTAEAPFNDIASQSQEFRTAIAWGYANGYLNGKGEGVFDPVGSVTRQEAMKILFGYDGGVSGMEAMFTGIYDGHYTDSGDIAAWGKAGMYWGVYRSLISGTTDTTLSPNGTATRAQLAKILTVYYDQQNKQ